MLNVWSLLKTRSHFTHKLPPKANSGYGQTTLDIRLGELLKENVQVSNLHLGAAVQNGAFISKKENLLVPFASSAAQQYQQLFGDTYAADDQANYSTKYGDIDFYQAVAGFASVEPYVYFRAYLSLKLAYLIKLLASMRDSDGLSLLDSTLVVHVTDQGDGRTHEGRNAPYFLAGAKRYFRNGLVLDVGSNQYDLMDTIGGAFGLTDVQYGQGLIRGVLL